MMKILTFDSLGSTNEYGKTCALDGMHSIVIHALTQTRGIGRFQRKWQSSKGGLYFSIVLKEKDVSKLQYLTAISALSVVKSVQKFVKASIKWPNDIYVNDRKLCGILTETIISKENYVIAGIGMNVNQARFPKQISKIATSLRIEAGRDFDIQHVMKMVLGHFGRYYKKYKKGLLDEILEEFTFYCSTMGKMVLARTFRGDISGRAVAIDSSLRLLVKPEKKRLVKITEGDVTLAKDF